MNSERTNGGVGVRRWVMGLVGILVLGCGGLGGAPGEFAVATAELMAKENNGVPCRLSRTGETTNLLDWNYTFGEPVVRPYPEEIKRNVMMVVPVTVENTQPTKRVQDRVLKFHRTDGEQYDAQTSMPKWLREALGKPNFADDFEPYKPGEKREVFVMLSAATKTSAVGGVMRMMTTKKLPDPNNPRRLTHQLQDHVCIEIASVTQAEPFVEP